MAKILTYTISGKSFILKVFCLAPINEYRTIDVDENRLVIDGKTLFTEDFLEDYVYLSASSFTESIFDSECILDKDDVLEYLTRDPENHFVYHLIKDGESIWDFTSYET